MVLPLVLPLLDRLVGRPGATANLLDRVGEFAVNLCLAVVILVATLWLSRMGAKLVRRSMARLQARGHHLDNTLSTFLSSLVRYAVLIVGLIAVLGQLGVKTTSILAVLGAASLAVGLALQGALSNVAAGVMLLILRPYHLDDFVEINGKKGKVRSLDLFVTELTAADGVRLILPNSKVLSDTITNYTVSGRRRMELKFRIDYADNADAALALLLDLARAEKRVLKEPKPQAVMSGLEDASVVLTLFAWTSANDIFDTEPAMIKAVKQAFDAAGFTFPYPHQVGLTRAEQAAIRPNALPQAEAITPPEATRPNDRTRSTPP